MAWRNGPSFWRTCSGAGHADGAALRGRGNLRIHRLLDRSARIGATVIDVGANIGYNTLYAARRVGPTGRVVAIEPTPDTLAVLRHNIAASGLANVAVEPVAAGSAVGTRDFFVRGDRSAVNSLFPESCYAPVTSVLSVPVRPLDDLVNTEADLVKIDVEGAEIDVLEGMPRLLRGPDTKLIVEWHPLLQQAAGYGADALPLWLLHRGWSLRSCSHLTSRRVLAGDLPVLTARLLRGRRPVDLFAWRQSAGISVPATSC